MLHLRSELLVGQGILARPIGKVDQDRKLLFNQQIGACRARPRPDGCHHSLNTGVAE